MIKKLFTHTALYGLAPQIPKVASFFALPIITKDLTNLDYGVSGIVSSYTASLSVFQSFGLLIVVSNSFFHYPNRYKILWRELHGFLSIWSIFYSLIVAAILFIVIPDEAISNRLQIIALNVLPLAFFSTTETFVFRHFQLNQKPIPLAIRTIFIGVITVILNVFFISYLKMGYMGWFYSTFLGSFISFLFYFKSFYLKNDFTPIFNFKWKTIKKSLKISVPTIPHYYSSYLLNTSDRVVMDVLNVNINSLGSYNLAANFGNYFSAIANASGLAMGPLLLERYKKKDYIEARRIVFITQILFFVLTFSISLWLKELFKFLIRNETLQNVFPLAILIIMGFNYRPMYFGALNRLQYQEKTNQFWKVSFVAGILNVSLNFIFIPIYGITAAAINTLIGLLYLGYSGFFLKSYKLLEDNPPYYPFLWFFSTILLTAIAYFFGGLSYYMKIIIHLFVLLLLIIPVLSFKLWKSKFKEGKI